MYKLSNIITCGVLVVLLGLWGCTSTKNIIQQPEPKLSAVEYQQQIQQGDTWFNQMHLYGWRKAAEYYNRAYTMKKSMELRDKYFLTLCLIAIRQFQEQIVSNSVYQQLDALGNFEKNQKQLYLWEMINHYRTLPLNHAPNIRIAAKEKKEVEASLFDLEHAALDTYLYLLCLNYYSLDIKVYTDELGTLLKKYHIETLLSQYARHPLFVYFNAAATSAQIENIDEQYGPFAELMVFKANELFKKNKLKQAGVYYQQALTWLPDYTQAINGIGNIYYFTLQNYEQAITYYQKTLDLDPTNAVALFGKGISLHQLGKYEESNQVLDFMLANQELYLGQATYYKAYNYYYLQDLKAAREWCNRAKDLLPRSGEAYFLSGLLYFKEEKWNEAEIDFVDALYDEKYSSCYPLYYLGMAKVQQQNWSFFKDFTDSIECFGKTITSLEEQLKAVSTMELDDQQQQWLVQNRTKTLAEYKEAAQQMSAQMNLIMAQNEKQKKSLEEQTIQKQITAIKTLLEKDPQALNRPDEKENGATLLHKAIMAEQKELVTLLLERGADLTIADKNGYLPLNWAIMMGNSHLTRLLIAKGAPLDHKGMGGMTLLHEAVYNGNVEMVKLLLAHGAQLDAREDLGKTPIDFAIEHKKTELLPLLKPLHMALQKGDMTTIKETFQQYPSSLAVRDEMGRTPLHLAASLGNTAAVQWLLQKGAVMEIRDIDGLTPQETALKNNHPDVAKLLRDQGAALTNQEMLARPLTGKEAILWHLGGPSWALRSNSHFFIFDYAPYPFKFATRPAIPMLGNGMINNEELKGQKLVYLLTHMIIAREEQNPVQDIKKAFPDMLIIQRDVENNIPGALGMAQWEKKEIANMKIMAVPAQGDTIKQGYVVTCDNLQLYYVGHHENWNDTMWSSFIKEIDFTAQEINKNSKQMDIVFFSLTGHAAAMKADERAWMEKGVRYLVTKLQPRWLVLMTAEGEETIGKQFLEEYQNKGVIEKKVTHLITPSSRGERFFFSKE